MYRILGGIYLSSLDPLTNGEDLKEKYGISHILSILPGSIPSQYTTNYIHKQIEITDEETTNILEHFPETNEFIESALQNSNGTTHANKILVHCAHGVSRSPTVIIAYLIHKYNLTFDQAFHALKRKNEAVSPNDSFLEQLEIFNKMHTLKLDQTSKLYKQFLISITLKQDPSGSSLKDLNIFTNMESRKIATKDVSKSYRCKRCRTTLATNHDVEDHEQPTEDSEQSKFIRRGQQIELFLSNRLRVYAHTISLWNRWTG